ncbi:undecaprenyl-diphosphatase [Peribacillus alkalitolerans]|uniref:undecaprenyl-diphosphatase n=1 Tax=Peribacillus alkalitolerans TaxID=1550385 RepID=UPI0013D798E0|nr:undecaprenyl-diphosphatase [Peribacillus alkalitolerans]
MINDLGKEYEGLNQVFVVTAEYTVYLLALALLIFWIKGREQNRMMVMSAVVAFGLAEVIGKLVGLCYSNYQPFAELADVNQLIEKSVNNSFPSDHTILFFSVCFTIWLFRKMVGSVFVIIAVCVGLSRIGVGVHYPGDVLVGAVVGIIAAVMSYWVVHRVGFFSSLLDAFEKGMTGKSKDVS